MTTSYILDGRIHFRTSSGATWSVPWLSAVGTVARKISGLVIYHDLFELEGWEKELWPWATHRMSLTPRFEQTSPLFSSCPVGLKRNCKFHILLSYGEEDSRHPTDQWKIEGFRIFEDSKVA